MKKLEILPFLKADYKVRCTMLINDIIQNYEQNNVLFLKIQLKTQYYFFSQHFEKKVYIILKWVKNIKAQEKQDLY